MHTAQQGTFSMKGLKKSHYDIQNIVTKTYICSRSEAAPRIHIVTMYQRNKPPLINNQLTVQLRNYKWKCFHIPTQLVHLQGAGHFWQIKPSPTIVGVGECGAARE